MTHDIFFAICQNEVDGVTPPERTMWRNFFSQVELADQLGFGCAWVAETHLSSEIQKRNPGAVIPSFKGEIGLNTDILQLAQRIFSRTKRINVGSAIRNILCNGGPIAHAEAVRTFLSLQALDESDSRLLELGFASGRFPYSNVPYGVRPRNAFEAAAWPVLKGLIFQEATEIFLRFLRGDIFSSHDVRPKILTRDLFRSDDDWSRAVSAYLAQKVVAGSSGQDASSAGAVDTINAIEVPPFWVFDQVGVIPFEAPLKNLRLTIGAHDAATQELANQFMPVGVFNLSITPPHVIEDTHERMSRAFHPNGGEWTRARMPRTLMVFPDRDEKLARKQAEKTLATYWRAMEGTVDPTKVSQAVENALVGTPSMIVDQMQARVNKDDRLMLWFDLNNHDNESVLRAMRLYMEDVVPHV
jgi:alkanesulfonate monooxygenase SsuD/methylene tetrahydromethanopterin reductase-like flavin-dependent oxidoreductase (luciferase family)